MKEGFIRRLLNPAVAVLCMSLTLTGCDPLHLGKTDQTSTPSNPPVTSEFISSSITESSPSPENVDLTAARRIMAETLISQIYSGLTGSELPAGSYSDSLDGMADGTVSINNIVLSIISSDEFSGLELSDEQFTINCYDAFLSDIPDEYEMRYYTDLLADGISREEIADMIMRHISFAELCSGYGFLPEFTPANTAYNEDRYGFIADTEFPEHLTAFGGYTPDSEALEALYKAMDEIEEQNHDFGFMVIDINSGKGISYNVDQTFYTASSIKGPFAASLACIDPDAAMSWENSIISMLVYSDNDAYTTLNNTYRRVYIQQWCEEIGIDPDPFRYKYPHISARQMAALWMRSCEFFDSGEFGEQVGSWFESPEYSLIHSELGEQYTTRSKAGWLVDDDPTHTTTIDAGIVYAENGPYVVVIMSDFPENIEPLRPLMQALEQTHLRM